MRGINRLRGTPSLLVWVSDDIRDAGGEADWLSCSSLRCLDLLGEEWKGFVRFSRIIGFQMAAETSLLFSLSQHSGNCGKTIYHPWHLCLGGNSLGFPWWITW